jgi:hypothetical protein
MGENETADDSKGFRKFLKRHWGVFAVFVVAAALAFAGAIYVFLWFVGNAQSTGLVPSTLALWTMGNIVAFILHMVFWELLLIGIPVGVGAVIGWQWWKRLPTEEKNEYRFFGKRSRTTGGSGGVSLFFFIAFCIKVFVDGNWNIAIASWTLDYVVGSMVTILVWVVVIAGIPAAIALVWWISHELKKT